MTSRAYAEYKLAIVMSKDYDPQESPAKLKLDHAEFEERRASLQREAIEINFNERGGLVLVLPSDPDVKAFIKELAAIERDPPADLKTARRRLRAVYDDYQLRVSMRIPSPNKYTPVFRRMVSLSAILIVRAEAKHLRKSIVELEHAERVNKHNRWAKAYAGLIRL